MKRAGVLLDRDGTIIEDYHYVGLPERVQLIPGAADAIARFNAAGIPVAIVTNQGGVARGFYTERDVHIVHELIMRELALHDAHIDLFLYSPHHPQSPIPDYRMFNDDHKPNPGMALRAAGTLHLDLIKSIVVGDRIEDVELAFNIGAEAVYIGATPITLHHTPFPSLAVAASYIIERLTGMANSDFPTMSYEGASGYFLHYADEIRHQLANVSRDPAALMRVANVLAKAYGDGSMVFIAGNGGAAAIANHMETDHVKHMSQAPDFYTNIRSLCSNQSVLTAIANDIGYDSVFSKQLETYANKDDVLVVFSVSGNSANVVRATQRAIEMGMRTVAIVGSTGGKLANIAENVIHIPNNNYGVVEDVMSIIQHVLAQFIRQTYMSDVAVRSAKF